jgi:TolA-binding protein
MARKLPIYLLQISILIKVKSEMKRLFQFLPILLFVALILFGCGSVRNRTGSKSKSDNNSNNTNNSIKGTAKSNPKKNFQAQKPVILKGRFSDTTVIYLSEDSKYSADAGSSPFQNMYLQAVSFFNNDDYTNACNLFKNIVDKYTEKDDIYYDSRFYTSECLILANDLETAEKLLLNTLDAPAISGNITEKVLVRLGHIYCLQNKESVAQRYFTRLKNEYPNSEYLKVASCK